ncbi:MAG: APC family permease, partial [Actinomycetes bacterium]
MPEQLAFARKASGLVRGLSMYDAFGIGIMTVQPIMGIWYMVLLGLGLFPGGNLLIAIGISAVTCGVFGPLVWGMLAGSMPRSGGEYIFNSRILHPVIALGASFAQVAAVIYWNFLISTWLAAPSLSLLAQYMGWDSMANWVTSKWGTFTLALVCL